MKSVVVAGAAIALLIGGVARAAEPTPAQQAQQARMTQCNKEAEGKTGDTRKAFMKTCLSAKPSASQQEKMKTCNHDAGDRKGDDRKAFMKECLSA
jgi:hypothetical protein